jgi:hypothetical protein
MNRTLPISAALVLWLGFGPISGGAEDAVVHEISLRHPVFRSETPQSLNLVQILDPEGFPRGYSLAIRTEVCREGVCQIAQLTMYWDAVGQYQRLELPLTVNLTKLDHVPFQAADYKRLDEILKNRASILGRYVMDAIAKGPEKTRVDGWTAATAAELEEEAVPDALYTSYTLWHWANGDVVEHIRRLTAARCSPPFIERLLKSDDQEHARFALKVIVDRQPQDPQFADAVYGAIDREDHETLLLAIRYLKGAVKEPATLHAHLLKLFHRAQRQIRSDLLDFFRSEAVLEPSVLEGLTEAIDRVPYVELHAILRLLESHRFHGPTTDARIAALLDHENFFIARRAYYYLREQETNGDVRQKLATFYQQHRDRIY